jgi:internalin A
VPGVDHPVRLNLWDFGGQDIYLGSHALFLQGQAVFLLLWHPDHEQGRTYKEGGFTIRDRPLAYWLDYLRGLAGVDRDGRRVVESPILLIRSQCDSETDERDPPSSPGRTDLPPPRHPELRGQRGLGNRELLDAHLAEAVGTGWSRIAASNR